MLAFLSSVAKGVPQKLEVMCQLVSSLFDLNPNISSYMKVRGGRRAGLGGGVCWQCAHIYALKRWGCGGCMLTFKKILGFWGMYVDNVYIHALTRWGFGGACGLSELCVLAEGSSTSAVTL